MTHQAGKYWMCEIKEHQHGKKRCCCGSHSSSDGKKSYKGKQYEKRFTNKGGRKMHV